MSKIYCNCKFDNEDLKTEFVKLLPNIAPDIASFLKGGLEVKGITADPEIVVDSEKEVIKVNMFSVNKGSILLLDDEVTYQDYSTIDEDALYALFNARTKNIEMFVKRDPVDVIIGQFASFRALDEGWRSIVPPAKPEVLSEETLEESVMEVDSTPVEEPIVEDNTADNNE